MATQPSSSGTASDATAVFVSPLQQSRVGRETQRYDGDRRLLACTVVTRHRDDGSKEVLLISSSKRPNEWIIPKGGWEEDESVETCAVREAEEEAGVATEIVRALGELDYDSSGGTPCRFIGFELRCTQQYDLWAEATRRREWVSFAEAGARLCDRPELLEMLHRAESD